jgi:hypothetical protein
VRFIQEGSASALSQLPFHLKNVSALRALYFRVTGAHVLAAGSSLAR